LPRTDHDKVNEDGNLPYGTTLQIDSISISSQLLKHLVTCYYGYRNCSTILIVLVVASAAEAAVKKSSNIMVIRTVLLAVNMTVPRFPIIFIKKLSYR